MEHDAVFNLDHEEIRPRSTSIFSQLEIKFDFYFTYQHNTCIRSQDSGFLECSPPSYDRTSAAVAVGESLSFDDIAAAVEDSIDGRLLGGDREGLIELACAEVRKRLETLPEDVALVLSFDVKIADRHVYVVESDDCPRMVPAADSSFALLENYDLDHGVGDGKVEGAAAASAWRGSPAPAVEC